MLVHAPVQEFGQRVFLDRPCGFPKIISIFFQAKMLDHAKRISPPIGDEWRERNYEHKYPVIAEKRYQDRIVIKKI